MTETRRSPDRDGVSAEPPSRAGADAQWIIDAYRQHFGFVHALVGRLGIPSAGIEDVVQEVFLVLHRRREEFRGESSVRTWLHGIAAHVARRHRDALRLRAERTAALAEPPGPPLPDAQLAQRRALQTLDRLLDELVDEQREVFVLTEIAGCSAPEIAAALGMNLNTVYSRLRLARERMQRALLALRAAEGAHHGSA